MHLEKCLKHHAKMAISVLNVAPLHKMLNVLHDPQDNLAIFVKL
jgi:hypothetical protein